MSSHWVPLDHRALKSAAIGCFWISAIASPEEGKGTIRSRKKKQKQKQKQKQKTWTVLGYEVGYRKSHGHVGIVPF